MQLLLRRKANLLPDIEWQGFLELQSHIDDFKTQQTRNEENLTTWQTIELMSQSISSYSGSSVLLDAVQAMVARVSNDPTEDPVLYRCPFLTSPIDSY